MDSATMSMDSEEGGKEKERKLRVVESKRGRACDREQDATLDPFVNSPHVR